MVGAQQVGEKTNASLTRWGWGWAVSILVGQHFINNTCLTNKCESQVFPLNKGTRVYQKTLKWNHLSKPLVDHRISIYFHLQVQLSCEESRLLITVSTADISVLHSAEVPGLARPVFTSEVNGQGLTTRLLPRVLITQMLEMVKLHKAHLP